MRLGLTEQFIEKMNFMANYYYYIFTNVDICAYYTKSPLNMATRFYGIFARTCSSHVLITFSKIPVLRHRQTTNVLEQNSCVCISSRSKVVCGCISVTNLNLKAIIVAARLWSPR